MPRRRKADIDARKVVPLTIPEVELAVASSIEGDEVDEDAAKIAVQGYQLLLRCSVVDSKTVNRHELSDHGGYYQNMMRGVAQLFGVQENGDKQSQLVRCTDTSDSEDDDSDVLRDSDDNYPPTKRQKRVAVDGDKKQSGGKGTEDRHSHPQTESRKDVTPSQGHNNSSYDVDDVRDLHVQPGPAGENVSDEAAVLSPNSPDELEPPLAVQDGREAQQSDENEDVTPHHSEPSGNSPNPQHSPGKHVSTDPSSPMADKSTRNKRRADVRTFNPTQIPLSSHAARNEDTSQVGDQKGGDATLLKRDRREDRVGASPGVLRTAKTGSDEAKPSTQESGDTAEKEKTVTRSTCSQIIEPHPVEQADRMGSNDKDKLRNTLFQEDADKREVSSPPRIEAEANSTVQQDLTQGTDAVSVNPVSSVPPCENIDVVTVVKPLSLERSDPQQGARTTGSSRELYGLSSGRTVDDAAADVEDAAESGKVRVEEGKQTWLGKIQEGSGHKLVSDQSKSTDTVCNDNVKDMTAVAGPSVVNVKDVPSCDNRIRLSQHEIKPEEVRDIAGEMKLADNVTMFSEYDILSK